MRWLRLWHETVDDPKVQKLSDYQFKRWINLLCIAGDNPDRGYLPPLDDIAFRLRLSELEAKALIEDLITRGLFDVDAGGAIRPHNWEIRQAASDTSTDRVREYRRRKREEAAGERSGNGGETLPKHKGNVREEKRGDKRRTEEIRANARNGAPSVLGASAESPNGANYSDPGAQPEHDEDDDADDKKPSRPAADPPGFAAAWDAYGHKKDRKQAVEQWRRMKPDEALQAAILAAIPPLHATDAWRRNIRKSFFRWLRDRNWEDEYPVPPTGARAEVIEIDVWEAEKARTRALEEQRARAQ